MSRPLLAGAALTGLIEAVLNPLLLMDARIADVLTRHDGARLRLNATRPALEATCTLHARGVRLALADDAPVDVELTGPLDALLRVLAGNDDALSELDVRGNVRLLQQLSGTLREFPFDLRGPLSGLIGDEAAIYVSAALHGAVRTAGAAGRRVAEASGAAIEPQLASPAAVERFFDGVADLRMAADRLEARIARLERTAAGTRSVPSSGTTNTG